ncbi:MAG: hypothetical protein B7Z55_15615, partial [Planctomycetales bacterium 12-60-4]
MIGHHQRNGRYDTEDIKRQAAGRWAEILASVAGIDRELLDSQHHPCPKCGGRDRFRLIDSDAGAVYCNQCFSDKNGDGLAAVQWMLGIDFPTALKLVGEYLNVSPASSGSGHAVAPKPKESEQVSSALPDQFDIIRDELQADLLQMFAASKPPITADAAKAAGGIAVNWPKRFTGDSRCIAWPAIDDNNNRRGW